MSTFKKHLEIFKINRQISGINRELYSVHPAYVATTNGQFFQSPRFTAPSEKENILRESINSLIDIRESIRNS